MRLEWLAEMCRVVENYSFVSARLAIYSILVGMISSETVLAYVVGDRKEEVNERSA